VGFGHVVFGFRSFAVRQHVRSWLLGLFAAGLCLGAILFTFSSKAQDDQLIRDIDQLINQMQGLRDRLIATRPPIAILRRTAVVRGFLAVRASGRNELVGAVLPTPQPAEDVYLPQIELFLRDIATNADGPVVWTDLSGRFTTRVGRLGAYQVCWKAKDLGSGCTDKSVNVDRAFTDIGTVLVPLPRLDGHVALFGHVTLADGSTPRTLDPTANINAFATITLIDPQGTTLYERPVNNHDQYLFAQVPLGQTLAVRIREEKYEREQPLRLGNATLPVQRIDLRIMNAPPRIQPLLALDAAKARVSNAMPGAKVSLVARVSDPDNDKLVYRWHVSSGSLSSETDPQPEWTLPTTQGNHAADLIVADAKGGYARSSINLTIDRNGLVFSGFVSGTDVLALAGAEVDVNGRGAVTDSRGFFRLRVPDTKRFVMTIRKAGYAFASKVYYDAVVGGSWRLTRANVFRVDPAGNIDLQQKRTSRECQGPPSARLNWRASPSLAVPQHQDGRGNITPLPKEAAQLPGLPNLRQTEAAVAPRECGPGVRVQIPANSLVDSGGRAPTGQVDVQLSTVDLQTPDQMPGDYSVVQSNNDVKVMQSYGAAIVEIRSGATPYNLKPGATASVVIPVDPAQIRAGGALPATIPLLVYNEGRGVWNESGTAQLQMVDGHPAYVSSVTHFTAYNMDLIKTDQSCVAIQNQNMPATYDLEITIPQLAGAAPVTRLKPGVVGGSSETALLNLPKDTNIVLVPIRTSDPDPAKNDLPMGVFVVNTGAPQNPAWPTVQGGFRNEPVPPYYHETNGVPDGACSTQVTLHDLGLQFYPATPPTGAFLHGLGSFAAVNLSDLDPAFPADVDQTLRDAVTKASQDYRTQGIDPRGLRSTLTCFKAVNRMPLKAGEAACAPTDPAFTPQSALTEVSAVYANSADLGFGREMHCVQDGQNVACYVSNYEALVYTGPTAAADVSKAQKAVDGFNGILSPDATVAMEFSTIEDAGAPGSPITSSDPQRVVKFYVFNNLGQPVNNANLDGLGQRPLPQLCMVCHGGQIPAAALPNPPPPNTPPTSGGVPTPVFASRDSVKLNAKFLPFDLRNFSFAAPDSDAANPFNKLNQQTAFRSLNQMAKVAPPPDPSDPSSNVISDLYDAWYPGNATPQVENAVVPLWNADALHRNLYAEVVGRACRTCHATNAASTLRFEKPGAAGTGFDGNLGLIQLRVCKQHVMPHARRTHDLFWTTTSFSPTPTPGPSEPAQLQAYGDSLNTNGWQNINAPGVDPALACGQEFTAGGGAPATGAFTPVATVFSGNCVGCHNAANAAPGSAYNVAGLDLGTNAYMHIVNTAATEFPALKRVEFGVATEVNSYLWKKISKTYQNLGAYQPPGPGDPMPDQGPMGPGLLASDQASADTIRNWIKSGAPP